MRNSNISGEMAQLMIKNQTKYVPSLKSHKTSPVQILERIFFDGDALTDERGPETFSGCLKMVMNHLTDLKD